MLLENLVPGAVVEGLVSGGSVVIGRVEPASETAVTVYFSDEYGRSGSRVLFAEDVDALEVRAISSAPALDVDPELFLEAFDAHRVREAGLHDPLLAVNSANIEPLPHQLGAVYGSMLPRRPLRFLLADDPGAGKTIMAGLYMRELLARRIARRCLVAAPGGLVEQWQEELRSKFGLHFTIFDRSLAQKDENPFESEPLLIIRVDQVARDKQLLKQLRATTWDLAVVDEAHKLSARYWGREIVRSKRYALGEVLGEVSTNFLLMTATPHSGKDDDFQLFMSLLDVDRFVGRAAHHEHGSVEDLMRRFVKEQLRHMDGRPLFPERRASTLHYRMRPQEQELYEAVSSYVRHEMNKIEGDETRRTVGFALLVLQRRLASSPDAILQSLTRRRDRLLAELDRARESDEALRKTLYAALSKPLPEEEDDLLAAERECLEDELSDAATASRSVSELRDEILLLDQLVALARSVREARVDRKWEQLARLLSSPEMHDADGNRRKLIVFTEHRDTLTYLQERMVELLGDERGLVTIHGGTSRPRRREAQQAFTADPTVSILLATDAAGEGVNLQCANLMVNYDLPWNPNRLEQRFGRIHRIGQTEVCHLWNLVAGDTREGDVFTTLLDKLERQRAALGDRVFDVLGEVLSSSDLSGLLKAAIRSGDRPEVRARLHDVVEAKIGHDMEAKVAARTRSVSALTDDHIDEARRRLAEARATSLQPAIVDRFVHKAALRTRCEVRDNGPGRLCVTRVSNDVRAWTDGSGPSQVRRSYEEVTFDPASVESVGRPSAELLAPGHPLVDALSAVTDRHYADALVRGTVLQDERSESAYVLALFRYGVWHDGLADGDEGRVARNERLACLRVGVDGCLSVVAPQAFSALAVPASAGKARGAVEMATLEEGLNAAREHVVETLIPDLLAEERSRIERHRRAELSQARERLKAEIERLKALAENLARRPDADPDEAREAYDRIDELKDRCSKREAEVLQGDLVGGDPSLVAVALVVPGAEPGFEARFARARTEVKHALQEAGRLDEALPMTGYDFMLTPSSLGGAPSFIAVRVGTGESDPALNDAEVLVQSNMGDAYFVASVDEALRIGWLEGRSPGSAESYLP